MRRKERRCFLYENGREKDDEERGQRQEWRRGISCHQRVKQTHLRSAPYLYARRLAETILICSHLPFNQKETEAGPHLRCGCDKIRFRDRVQHRIFARDIHNRIGLIDKTWKSCGHAVKQDMDNRKATTRLVL